MVITFLFVAMSVLNMHDSYSRNALKQLKMEGKKKEEKKEAFKRKGKKSFTEQDSSLSSENGGGSNNLNQE